MWKKTNIRCEISTTNTKQPIKYDVIKRRKNLSIDLLLETDAPDLTGWSCGSGGFRDEIEVLLVDFNSFAEVHEILQTVGRDASMRIQVPQRNQLIQMSGIAPFDLRPR